MSIVKIYDIYTHTERLRPLTETLALIGGTVNIHFGADDVAKGQKHLRQFGVAELLRQMIDEEIATFRTDRRRRSLVYCSCQTVDAFSNVRHYKDRLR